MEKTEIGQKKRTETLCAPQEGVLVPLPAVPPVPRTRDVRHETGFAVKGVNGDIVSPVGGTITSVSPDGTVGIRSDNGVELRLSVGSGREHLHLYAETGSHVAVGQRLLHADLDGIRRAGGRTECVVLLPDGTPHGTVETRRAPGGSVRAGSSPVLSVTLSGS